MTRVLAAALGAAGCLGLLAADGWEKEIAAFEERDRTDLPAPGGVLFVGSSSIRLWTNLAAAFPEQRVVQRGFGGARFTDVNAYFDRLVLPCRPAKIVVYAGENDLAAGRSAEEVFAEFKKFADKARAKLPGTKVYYLSMKPSPSRWSLSPQINEGNRLIRNRARVRSRVTFVDVGKRLLNEEGRPDPAYFLNDELHLNETGYALWAREIRRALKD